MSKKFEPINRIGGLDEHFEAFPKLPLLLPVKSWLLNSWPRDVAWFKATPTKKKFSGRTVWKLEAYYEGRHWATIEDLARLDILEALVQSLRAKARLPPPATLGSYG
jgi:hypothetical protein